MGAHHDFFRVDISKSISRSMKKIGSTPIILLIIEYRYKNKYKYKYI